MTSLNIVDIIQQGVDSGRVTPQKPLVSLEFFPPRSKEAVENLYLRMARMKTACEPIFGDITWGAGGSTATLSMDIALHMHQALQFTTNLHMTCTNLAASSTDQVSPKEAILQALQTAVQGGIRNIVALRGDPPVGQETWTAVEGGFTCALDLVRFIRQHWPLSSDVGITVAGYPEGHPNAITKLTLEAETDSIETRLSPTEQLRYSVDPADPNTVYCCLDADYAKELDYLKQKVDAGADLIITQMFFDAAVFIQFVRDCREIGITCPIIPGLMCINAVAGFFKMTAFCKSRVPPPLQQQMVEFRDHPDRYSDADVKAFGVEFGTRLCRDIMAATAVPVLHFYTLNLEKVVYGILRELGLGNTDLLDQMAANRNVESDATTQTAVGSAWARVGDIVQCIYGTGTVLQLQQVTGAATVRLTSWTLANNQHPTAYLQKHSYTKVFS